MADPAFSLAVYCGSRSGDNPLFAQAAQAVGHWIGGHGGQLVYGGGHGGLMGTVADATQAAGGRVVGVIRKVCWIKNTPAPLAMSCILCKPCTSAKP